MAIMAKLNFLPVKLLPQITFFWPGNFFVLTISSVTIFFLAKYFFQKLLRQTIFFFTTNDFNPLSQAWNLLNPKNFYQFLPKCLIQLF